MASPSEQSFANLTPMLRQYTQAKAAHPDTIVLFRLGDFYEMFDEDAHLGSRLLELVLTSREIGKGHRVPMCGVPVHAVETYIARLIKAGCKVAGVRRVGRGRVLGAGGGGPAAALHGLCR